MEKMPSSSDEATPPQGPEIWSVPFDPNSEITHNTVVEMFRRRSRLLDGKGLSSSLLVPGWIWRWNWSWGSRGLGIGFILLFCYMSDFRRNIEIMHDYHGTW